MLPTDFKNLRVTLDRSKAGISHGVDGPNAVILEDAVNTITGPTFAGKVDISRQMLLKSLEFLDLHALKITLCNFTVVFSSTFFEVKK